MFDLERINKRGPGRPPISDGRPFHGISIEEQIERWERVRTVLRKMTPHRIDNHFDMTNWATVTDCGTVGCAAGQCGMDPWFNRRGFRLKIREGHFAGWEQNMGPETFFGVDGYYAVFVEKSIMEGPRGTRKPRAQHRLALRAVNQYLKSLKS